MTSRLLHCHSREDGNPFAVVVDPRLRGDDAPHRIVILAYLVGRNLL